jgi:hypothetical protein
VLLRVVLVVLGSLLIVEIVHCFVPRRNCS